MSFGFTNSSSVNHPASRSVTTAENYLQKWLHMAPKLTGHIQSLPSSKLTLTNPLTKLRLLNPPLGLACPMRVLNRPRSPEHP